MKENIRTLSSLLENSALKDRRVMVRADLNVPMVRGRVSDYTRIERSATTINALIEQGARVVVTSHFGRPKDHKFDPNMSLAPIADALGEILGKNVRFGVDCIGVAAREAISSLPAGEVLLLENLRFHEGEKKNDSVFAGQLSENCDLYINDAFSCSHRSHASITGITKHLPSYAGLALEAEIENLDKVMNKPDLPVAAIVGGSKISTKIAVLEHLAHEVDYLIIGGAMANTFLHVRGVDVGNSLCEKDLTDIAKKIENSAKESGCKILLPSDGIVSEKFAANPKCRIVHLEKGDSSIAANEMLLDIGPQTLIDWSIALQKCKTIIWNGPLGAFELSPFDTGTIGLARMVASLTEYNNIRSVAGGGDVLAALSHAGIREMFSYVSTAGGAFLEWLEGKSLPGIIALAGNNRVKLRGEAA